MNMVTRGYRRWEGRGVSSLIQDAIALGDRPYGWNYARAWSKLTVRASQYWQVKAMAISVDTLKAMIRDFHGLEISDEEFELVLPAIEGYLAEVEKLKDLDLSNVLSSRLLRAKEGGES